MLFLDISSDYVKFAHWEQSFSIHRNDVDSKLGIELTKLYRETSFTEAVVLNGPGGFTNLRVGCLCVNFLNSLAENKIDIYSVTKQQVYTYLYEQKILPQNGIIYIGQKKNVRNYDFATQTYTTIKKDDLPTEEYFLDEVGEEDYYLSQDTTNNIIKHHFENNGRYVEYQGKKTRNSFPKIWNTSTKRNTAPIFRRTHYFNS